MYLVEAPHLSNKPLLVRLIVMPIKMLRYLRQPSVPALCTRLTLLEAPLASHMMVWHSVIPEAPHSVVDASLWLELRTTNNQHCASQLYCNFTWGFLTILAKSIIADSLLIDLISMFEVESRIVWCLMIFEQVALSPMNWMFKWMVGGLTYWSHMKELGFWGILGIILVSLNGWK